MENQREIREFELDFSMCTTLGELYKEIREKLDLPDNCGRNLNALWDAVTGMMYTPARITVCNRVKNAALTEDVKKIISILYEAEEKYRKIEVNELQNQNE